MEFKASGRHIEITPAIHDYAQKKTQRLHRYFDRIQSIEAIVDKRDHHQFEVELVVDVEHNPALVAKEKHDDLYAAIDQVTDKMERRLTDHKERLRNRKHIA